MSASLRSVVNRFCVILGLALIAGVHPGVAAADLSSVKAFDIQPQPVASALLKFSSQSGVQVMSSGTELVGKTSHRVVGRFVAQAALDDLLRGTGLHYDVIDSNSIAIRLSSAAQGMPAGPTGGQPRSAEKAGRSFSDRFQIAHEKRGADTAADPVVSTKPRPAGEEGVALQEVIVTAQKYRQRLFDVPVSMQVVGGTTLLRHGITSLNSLQFDVPGLYMDSNGTTRNVYLRGVGDENGNGAMVGQYIDDADITPASVPAFSGQTSGDGGLYDLKRVEVLKGPQGTLFGDGSMGGVIRYITNKPVLDRFEMSANVAALFTQYGAPSQRIESMINTPLIHGTLGLRFAGMSDHDGGWVDEPAANLKNINGRNVVDARVEALWKPAARLRLRATELIHRRTGGFAYSEDSEGNFTPGLTLAPPTLENQSDLSNLTISYRFGGTRLLSSSSYSDAQQQYNNQSRLFPIGTITYGDLIPFFRTETRDSSEELRLVHSGVGPWQWTVGAFYKSYRFHPAYPGVYLAPLGTPLSSLSLLGGFDERGSSRSWAGYADTSYRLFRRLTLGAGVRYFKDRETLGLVPSTPVTSASFASTDPRFYAQYRVTRRVNVYASASKGFRSGGFNQPPYKPYQPEVLWSYDLGAKVRVPETGVRTDVDAFLMNYTNFVDYVPVPLNPNLSFLANVGEARITGVDADMNWQPIDRWRLGFNTEILKTEFLKTSSASFYSPGDRLPYAPVYSFTASVRRSFRWLDRPGDIEVYYYEISSVQLRYGPILSESSMQRRLGLRGSIHWNHNVSFAVFGHNLLNNRGVESPDIALGESIRPRPRTFGVEFDVKFGQQ